MPDVMTEIEVVFEFKMYSHILCTNKAKLCREIENWWQSTDVNNLKKEGINISDKASSCPPLSSTMNLKLIMFRQNFIVSHLLIYNK